MNINKIVITGNLVKDLEVRTFKDFTIGNFTVANNVGYGDNKRTNFINCSIIGEARIEALEKYLVKGVGVVVSGELEIKVTNDDDEYKTYTQIKVDNIEITKFKEHEEEVPKKQKNKRYK